ncbi:uncharacterized [Tachysurus ichikawai]
MADPQCAAHMPLSRSGEDQEELGILSLTQLAIVELNGKIQQRNERYLRRSSTGYRVLVDLKRLPQREVAQNLMHNSNTSSELLVEGSSTFHLSPQRLNKQLR